MESSPCMNGSYNWTSDTVHGLPAEGLVSRLFGGCFSPRGMFSFNPEEPLSFGYGACSIELSDQDSAIFQTYVDGDLEFELEPYDSAVPDLGSSAAFPDWEVPADSEPADPQKCVPDIILEDGDFEYALSPSSPQCGLVKDGLKSLAAGLLIHFVGLCLFLSAPTPLPKGLGGISDKPILIRIPVTLEAYSPDIPSNASADSPGSTASLARRHPKAEETGPRKESRKEPAAEMEANKVIEKPEHESRPLTAKLAEEPVPTKEKIPQDVSLRDGPPNDSESSQDSVASAPSVASPERKGALKAGDEAESYKDKIFSAIHQAAYYPRAALRKMAYGKAVVSFTINKDGSLANIFILGHSASETLDDAALKIVEQASSQFPPIPEELMKDQVTYVVPIIFKRSS